MKIDTEKAIEIVGWKSRKLDGYELMTAIMLVALSHLLDSKHKDFPFSALDGFDPRTGKALVRRDWAFVSCGMDGKPAYKITGRGESALAVYSSPPKRRTDGACAVCGAERHVGKTGFEYAYCIICLKKRRENRKRYGKNPGICPSCGERDKHITENGIARSYCKPCRHKKAKRYRKRAQKRLNWKKNIGLSMKCYRCKRRERHRYGNTVSDYCLECARDYQKQYRRRKIWDKHMNNEG